MSVAAQGSDRRFYVFNALLSVTAIGFLGWLLILRGDTATAAGPDLRFMPAVNASLNATAAAFLVAGWLAIRRRRVKLHRYCMVSAFAASSVFLVGYVIYHYVHGDTRYTGEGALRYVYLSILASHVLLSMSVVPLSVAALWLAWRRRFDRHRRVARILLPIWLYVSVTGVVIFFMLRGSLPIP